MSRLYVNQTLEKQIRQYCELNEIDDINAFANRCLSQGFNIVKFGLSPADNVKREVNGVKDVKSEKVNKNKPNKHKEEKQIIDEAVKTREINKEEEVKEVKTPVTVRKIQVIKKG